MAGVGEVSIRDRARDPVYGDRGSSPDSATVNPRLKLLMFIAARRTERRDRCFVARDVGSGRSGMTGNSDAA